MASRLPPYSDIADTLSRVGSDMEVSEIHATLCGLLCNKNSVDSGQWLSICGLIFDNTNLLHKEAMVVFDQLYGVSLEQLNDSTCDFHMLLPEDGSGLQNQVHALGEWCQGYLLGLSAAGTKDFAQQPDDVAELLRDMTEIARAETSYSLDGSEDDEQAYEQLVEYVRIGVLLINEELNPIVSSPVPVTSPH